MALLDIWKIEGIAACNDATALANALLESCIIALDGQFHKLQCPL